MSLGCIHRALPVEHQAHHLERQRLRRARCQRRQVRLLGQERQVLFRAPPVLKEVRVNLYAQIKPTKRPAKPRSRGCNHREPRALKVRRGR
jgi:hypothetical protein